MSISLYSAASGMEAQQTNLNVISNNIANVNTTDSRAKSNFKTCSIKCQSLWERIREAAFFPPVFSGTQVVATSKVFTRGQVNRTDEARRRDRRRWIFSVENENEIHSIRRWQVQAGPAGQLTTSQGMTLEPGITVPTRPTLS